MTGEAAQMGAYLCRTLDRVLGCLEGLTEHEARWTPPADGANSLVAIASHVLSNAEENVLGVMLGQPVQRARLDEFGEAAAMATAAEIQARWLQLRARIERSLAEMSDDALATVQTHPRRGALSRREVLWVAMRHAAEHQGQAELTRDLLLARRA